MSDCEDRTAYILHEQLACTSSIMDQHQAVKAEAVELKCEVCGYLISTSSDGSSRCRLCQDLAPYLKQDYILPGVRPCTKRKRSYGFYSKLRPEDYKGTHLMTRLTRLESQKQGH